MSWEYLQCAKDEVSSTPCISPYICLSVSAANAPLSVHAACLAQWLPFPSVLIFSVCTWVCTLCHRYGTTSPPTGRKMQHFSTLPLFSLPLYMAARFSVHL